MILNFINAFNDSFIGDEILGDLKVKCIFEDGVTLTNSTAALRYIGYNSNIPAPAIYGEIDFHLFVHKECILFVCFLVLYVYLDMHLLLQHYCMGIIYLIQNQYFYLVRF